MASKITITRIDFVTTEEMVVVNKVYEGVLRGNRDIVVDTKQHPIAKFEGMLDWCEKNGWIVRRFEPRGARAWKGSEPRPVRTKKAIKKLAMRLQRDGFDSNRFDLRYDM